MYRKVFLRSTNTSFTGAAIVVCLLSLCFLNVQPTYKRYSAKNLSMFYLKLQRIQLHRKRLTFRVFNVRTNNKAIIYSMKLIFWTWQMLNIPSCCLLHTKLYLCNRDLGYLVQIFRQYNSALVEEAC